MSDFMLVKLKVIHDLGFTGTRKGMTEPQKQTVIELLQEMGTVPERVHHGDCIGSDADFHQLVREHLYTPEIHAHPPVDSSFRAYSPADFTHFPEVYLERNKKIVNESNYILATPDGPERVRSGTWTTIRYARKRRKDISIVMPDGSLL